MPATLKDRLDAASTASGRSLTAEIVSRLEGTLDRDKDGNIVLPLPEDLMDRIVSQARHDDIDPLVLIRDALESAFPPPTLSLGEIIRQIKASLSVGSVKDEKTKRELEEYLRGAEALLKAEPRFEHVSVNVEKSRRT